MKKAFTITELLLAITLMVVLIAASGIVFKTAVKAYRTASATAEIARKLRGITDQLNADFKSLRKDGEIFIFWLPYPVDDDGDGQVDRYERFDRIMFFADGDFQSYNEWPMNDPAGAVIHGNTARISYMLAEDYMGNKAQQKVDQERVLARSQHIYAAEAALVDFAQQPDGTFLPVAPRSNWINPGDIPNSFIKKPPLPPPATNDMIPSNNTYEYDNLTLAEWLNCDWVDKSLMLTVVSDVSVGGVNLDGGLVVDVDSKAPVNVHQLLTKGVGSFSIQGWYELAQRWFPEVVPDGQGNFVVNDFRVSAGNPGMLDLTFPPRLIYPWPWDLDPVADAGVVDFGGSVNYPRWMIKETNFNQIPGLGRALKFTFTLYDSRGVFKEGKKFTHIVYLDE